MELLKEADVVVTNPPFSLFRQYVSTLVDFKKDFVIVGPDKGRKYKETFPLIRDNKMWLGATNPKRFYVPDSYQSDSVKVDDDGRRYMQMGNICWYTNLDIKKRHEELILFQRYAPEKYPSYTNFDGIDVAHVSDIPCDYPGNMGVPINFLDQYNPNQFEIVGLGEGRLGQQTGIGEILPEHRAVMTKHAAAGDLYYLDDAGRPKFPFARIVVRNRNPEQSKEVQQ